MSSPVVVNKRRLSAKEIAEGKVAAPQPISKRKLKEAGVVDVSAAVEQKKAAAPTTSAEKKRTESKIDRVTGAVAKKGVIAMGAEDLFVPAAPKASSQQQDGSAALRSSIADLYKLGASLNKSYKYMAPAITTTSLSTSSSVKKQKTADGVSTDQIWGQLSLLGAPLLQDIGVSIGKLSSTYMGESAAASSSTADKKGGKKGKKIAFDDDDEDIDDEDLDVFDEEDDDDDMGSDDEGSDADEGSDSDDEDGSDSDLDADPQLAAMMSSRKGNKATKAGKKAAQAAARNQALLDFAADGDDGENDDDEWAAEFETRRDRDGDDDDDEDANKPRELKLSKRDEKMKKKLAKIASKNNKEDDDDAAGSDDLGEFGDDGGFGGLYGDEEEGEEDEEDGNIMGELYGDDYEDDEAKFIGEDEEDGDVHGTSDEEGEEDGDGDELYDADEDARYQKNMFPTDNDDGFDNILDDREGYFGGAAAGGNNGEEGEDDEDYDGLTDFQIRQKQEAKFIGELEQKRAYNADWAMTGEVEGRSRPKDSLIDEELDFEHGMKSVPVITEGLTAKLEERIKKRILDQNFDDVVRRQAATSAADLTSNGIAKRDTTLDAEKSKASLMDLYEKDYLAKLKKMEDAAGMNENIAEPLTEIEKDELKAIQMWKRLAQHLDALSNYYFTPKPVQEDLNVRVRAVDKAAPAISMESVGAFAISRAAAVAPQDTFRPAQKSMLGNVSLEEMTPRERQALRRSKKEASATTKARVEKQVAERKKRRVEAEAAKSQ